MPTTVPNQKIITVNKEPTNKTHLYAAINLDAMSNAAKHLNGRKASGFLLWCYFSKNQNQHSFALSNVAVKDEFGMSRDAYNTAVQLLIEDGFLQQRKNSIFYDFVEYPEAHKKENGVEG